VASSGRSIGSVAKELGLRDSVSRRWVELRGAGREQTAASRRPTTQATLSAADHAAEIARIRAKHIFLKPLTIPAGSYPNQSEPIHSVGSWSFVLVRADLDDDVAYRLARNIHGIEAEFCKKLAQACETTAANTYAVAPSPDLIHPGVLKYLREIAK
jgi:uncharacterized protein